MKPEGAIFLIAILIIGIIILKNVVLPAQTIGENTTEENKVAYRYDIEDQNFTEINQNTVEAVDTTVNVENVIDVSAIEELRKEAN